MSRFAILVSFFVLPALVSARRSLISDTKFVLQGKVYCDTCRAGFETSVSIPIQNAKVKVECRDRETEKVLYTKEATTNSIGNYEIHVTEDHYDQICEAALVSSPNRSCNKPSSGRDRSRVILTNNNGISSGIRFANAMGFDRSEPLPSCKQVMQQFQLADD